MQILEQQQTGLAKEVSKLEAQLEIMNGNLKEEQARVSELENNANEVSFSNRDESREIDLVSDTMPISPGGRLTQLSAQRGAKKDSTSKAAATFAALKVTYDTSAAALKSSEDLLQTLLTGVSSSSDESTSSGFMGQLATAKALASNLGNEAQRARVRIEHLQKQVKEKEPKAKKAASEGKGLLAEVEAVRKEKVALEAALAKLDWDENQEASLRDRKDVESKAVRKLLEVSGFVCARRRSCIWADGGMIELIVAGKGRDQVDTRLARIRVLGPSSRFRQITSQGVDREFDHARPVAVGRGECARGMRWWTIVQRCGRRRERWIRLAEERQLAQARDHYSVEQNLGQRGIEINAEHSQEGVAADKFGFAPGWIRRRGVESDGIRVRQHADLSGCGHG